MFLFHKGAHSRCQSLFSFHVRGDFDKSLKLKLLVVWEDTFRSHGKDIDLKNENILNSLLLAVLSPTKTTPRETLTDWRVTYRSN